MPILASIACVLAGAVLFARFAECQTSRSEPRALVFLSGPKEGEYYRLAESIARIVRATGIRVSVKESPGSVSNLQQLARGEADLILVQSNVLSGSDVPARPLASLSSEAVHLVSRHSLAISALEQLAGKRVFLGLPGSGSRVTAIEILGAAGISPHQVDDVRSSTYSEALRKVKSGKVDVAFFTFSEPAAVLRPPLFRKEIDLVPVPASLVKSLLLRSPCYVGYTISTREYRLNSSVPTVAVRSILAAGLRVSDDEAYRITRAVFSRWGDIANELGYAEHLTLAAARSGIDRPLHAGAQRFFDERRVRALVPDLDLSWITILLLISGLTYLVFGRRDVLRWILHRPVFVSVLALAMAWLVGAVGMYVAEHHVNERFDPLPEAMWSVVVYLFSGFEDRYPITEAGRMVTIAIMVMGAASLAVITASLAAALTKRRLEGTRMPGRLKGHYVICNFDARVFSIIRQLHGKVHDEHVPIVIVSDSDELRLPDRKEDDLVCEDVFTVRGDPTDARMLKRINAQDARCVIILAQGVGGGHASSGVVDRGRSLDLTAADARSVMTLMAIQRVCRASAAHGGRVKYVDCVVEILDPRNAELAREIGMVKTTEGDPQKMGDPASGDGESGKLTGMRCRQTTQWAGHSWVQVVSPTEIETLLICQSAHTPGLARLYRRLLTFSEETNEFYIVDMPKSLYQPPACFRDAVARITAGSRDRNPVIPIGVQLPDGSLEINPREQLMLKEDHKLVVLAYREPEPSDLDATLLD